MSELIKVTQLPVIEERLRSAKDAVDQRVAEAMALVCTEETVQTVKAARAELRKQFDELEEQRKAVRAAVLDPYNRFEQIYRECVSDAFRSADAALKQKIGDVEFEIKRRCEDGLREYFAELCAADHLEWLCYEKAGVKVDMASAKQKTPKKLREQLAQFVANASHSVEIISNMENAEEILVEYKRTMSLSDAIGIVHERHRRIDEEQVEMEARAAAKAQETEAVKKVEAVAPPVQMKEEKKYKVAFTIYPTEAQLEKLKPVLRSLKEFLNMEGIRYE